MLLPNLLWEAQNHFVTLDLLKFIHARDVARGRMASFLHDQLTGTFLPLVLAGLGFYFFSRQGKPFRMVGWMYVVTLGLFIVAKGKTYYMCPAYPMVWAGGSVWLEGWLAATERQRAVTIWGIAWAMIAYGVIFTSVYYLPIAPVNVDSHWWQKASALQETYIGEIGWPELAKETARIRDLLSAEQRAHLGILAGGYGQTGAIDLFGAQYGLPRAISGIDSYWQQGYGDPPPQALIVMGLKRHLADESFEACTVAGHIWNRYGVKTPDMAWNPEIYVCGPPRQGWPTFWKHFRYFG